MFRLPDDPRRVGADVQKEIELHLELKARELEASGLAPEEARRAARASFGDPGTVEAECRELRAGTVKVRRRGEIFAGLRHDLRTAVRSLLRSPGFALVAVLTLALGIGANAGIFAVVRSVLLAPLGYPEPDRLVQLWADERRLGRAEPEWLTPPDFEDWRDQNQTFSGMAAYLGWQPDLTGTGDPESLTGAQVSWNFFSVLGTRPGLGRDFRLEDDDAGSGPVVMLSDGLWRRRFGADPAVIGRAITLNGEPWTVVGVLPGDFRPPLAFTPDLYRPIRRPASSGCGRDCVVLRAVGRMKPGVTLERAQEDLAGVAGRLEREYPDSNRDRGAWLVSLTDQLTGSSRAGLLALAGAVGMVLLIACVNLASLLLVRGAGRARELAVRAALGAGRRRLIGQLLTESLLLAVVGGALGLGLAFVLKGVLVAAIPEALRQIRPIRLDYWVVLFTAGVTVAAGVMFGLLPAFRSIGGSLTDALRTGRAAAPGDVRLRGSLVAAELALSVVLLVGAGLLLRSFVAMQRQDLGLRTEGLVNATVNFPRTRYQDLSRSTLAATELLDRLRAEPGVRRADATDQPPFSPGDQDTDARAVGEPAPEPSANVWYRTVSTGYFGTMGMRLVAGRGFEPSDREGAAPVAIVNEAAAKKFWRGQSPVGRELAAGVGDGGSRLTIVGVVANALVDGPGQPAKPELFVPMGQFPVRSVTVVIEPVGSAASGVNALRTALAAVDPLVPISGLGSLAEGSARAVALPRTYAAFVGVFAAAALLLAGLGVYGVIAFSVAQRQREFGIRLALGASTGAIRRMVLDQGARLVVAGAGLGLVGALVGARLIRSLLFGVGPFDPATMAAVLAGLGLTALVAAWVPARRATRVDPIAAIRDE